MTSEEIRNAINSLQRYEEQTRNYYTEIDEDDYGGYVKIEDVINALGLIYNSCEKNLVASVRPLEYGDNGAFEPSGE